jgi:hypothetical protein
LKNGLKEKLRILRKNNQRLKGMNGKKNEKEKG